MREIDNLIDPPISLEMQAAIARTIERMKEGFERSDRKVGKFKARLRKPEVPPEGGK